MKKKIALILGEITGSFQETIMRAAVKRANELGYNTVSFCTYGAYNNDVHLANGEKACAYIMDYSEFDGIIVSEDLFDIEGMGDEIYSLLMKQAKCPIVYTRTEREGCYSIFVENYDSMKRMTNHFIKDHGFTDICYMSGRKGFIDTNERYAGFADAMKEAGLSVDESKVFYGDFWREKGKAAVDYFLSGRDKYPEAIICANDFMALSVIDELKARNIRVPEDICISGFDYIEEARINQPSLTSFNVNFEKMAIEAVDIIDRVNMAIHQDNKTYIKPELMLHSSCGCGQQWKYENITNMLRDNYNQIYTMKNIMLASTEYQDSFEIDECFDVADRYFSIFRSNKAWLCMCENGEDGKINSDNISSFPEKMILKRIFMDGVDAVKLNVKFDRKNLLPEEYLNDSDTQNLAVFSIHFKNRIYGYMVAQFPEDNWFDIYSQAYLANLGTAIENAIVHGELASFEQIKDFYQKDSLTGLFNRREFEKYVNEKYKDAIANDKDLVFVSIDMDRLKYINDTFGHTEGDRAINHMADAIVNSISEGDIAARVGGDEFYLLLEGTSLNRGEEFKKKLEEALEKLDITTGDYEISASVGIATLNENHTLTTQSLMQLADMRMYDNKRSKNACTTEVNLFGSIDWKNL